MVGEINGTTDYFKDLYLNPYNIAFFMISWTFLEVIGNGLLLGMIWYERFGTNYERTLLNSLNSYTCICILFNNIISVNVMCFRFSLGPYPPFVCIIQSSIQHWTFFSALLSVNESVIFRYLYAFKWKNVGALNDDFFEQFLTVLNTFFGGMYAMCQFLVYNIYRLDYALCTGEDPQSYEEYPKVYPKSPSTILCLLTGILYLFLHMKMFVEKRKSDLKKNKVQCLKEQQNRSHNCFAAMGNHSAVADLFSTAGSVFCLLTIAVIPSVILRLRFPNGTESESSQETMQFVLIPSIHLMYYFVGSLISPIIIYIRNKKMRIALLELVKA